MRTIQLLIFWLMGTMFSLGQCLRQTAYEDYQTYFVNTRSTSMDWTGNAASCVPGDFSASAKANMIIRINYMRRLAGVPYPVSHDPTKDSLAQRASLIMQANRVLTHHPASTLKCYTPAGYDGASNSLLCNYSATSSETVSGFVDDPGVGNELVGHRRWLLWPGLNKVGFGSTTGATAIYIKTEYVPYPSDIKSHSYPGKGYMPRDLVFDRWSYSMPGADFSNAIIEVVKPDGSIVSLEGTPRLVTGTEPAIIWTPGFWEINTYSPFDLTYTVNIRNVKIGITTRDISYDVILFNPSVYPPPCPTGKTWKEQDCSCTASVTSVTAGETEAVNSCRPNPFENHFTLQAQDQSSYAVYKMDGTLMEKGTLMQDSVLGEHWQSGIYFLVIMSPQGKIRKEKIVKQ